MDEGTRLEEASGFTCEICTESKESIKKFKNGGLCDDHPYCLECIAQYIEAKVQSRIGGGIKCPGLSCNRQLNAIACRNFLPTPLFRQWCDLLCELKVLEFKNCYCPFRDCSALVLDECDDKPKKVKCPSCKKDFCFQCQLPWWHAGYQCYESRQFRDRNDILFGELIDQKKWTVCRHCGSPVERIGGCVTIHCRCGKAFCHKCGRPGQHIVCDVTENPTQWISMVLLTLMMFMMIVGLFRWMFFSI